MGKKRHSFISKKLASSGHYSSFSGTTAGRTEAALTVNEILTNLRTRSRPSDASRAAPVIVPSLPAEIRHLLDIPETPLPTPRNRRSRFDGEGRRLPPGPAPPRGWLEGSVHAGVKSMQPSANLQDRMRNGVESLPGVRKCPPKRSLMSSCMREIAQNWSFHLEYDQHYLATLPTEIRMLLFSYVASYGPEEGVGIEGLKTTLLPGKDQLEDFCGNDDFHRLDLSGSMGRSISFKQLEKVIVAAPSLDSEKDDWEEAITKLTLSPPIPTILSHSLRYLSLSNPRRNISWAALLDFASHVPLITHLSLAGWPTPCLTPNSVRSTMTNPYLRGLSAGGTNFYSHTVDYDWSEASNILQNLSKSLYSLEWLDLDGCNTWTGALYWDQKPCINWATTWRNVSYVSLRSNTIPQGDDVNSQLYAYKKDVLRAMTLEDHIRKERGWISVEHDEWNQFDYLWGSGTDPANLNSKSLLCEKLDYTNFGTIRDVVLAVEIRDQMAARAASEMLLRRREEQMQRLESRF